MQLQAESIPALNTVTAYGNDYIEINAIAYRHAVYFRPEGDIRLWEARAVSDISATQLKEIAGVKEVAADPMAFLDDAPAQKSPDAPEVILIGTGTRQQFLPRSITQALIDLGIGVEAMSTQAAARTYNILMSEGRRVIVALLPLEP